MIVDAGHDRSECDGAQEGDDEQDEEAAILVLYQR